MPAGILKALRQPDIPNPDPVMVTPRIVVQTSRPVKSHLLCRDCENLFSKKGEQWVIANMARPDSFPLYETINKATPVDEDDQIAIYRGSQIQGVALNKLVFFALSVFWKSAVHKWGRGVPRLALGPYEEPIGKFLLGEVDFPPNIAIALFVLPSRPILDAAVLPCRASATEYHEFRFYIPGIEFRLCTGQRIPSSVRRRCCYSSPEQLFAVMKGAASSFKSSIGGAWEMAHVSKKLRSFLSGSERPRR
jgi:hypothetical protein